MRIVRAPSRFLPAAAACAAALLLGLVDLRAALAGWLAALCLAIGVPFGCLLLVAVMRLVPGRWRTATGRQADAGLSLLIFAMPAALPILAGAAWLYPWAGAGDLEGFKAVYLTQPFFGLRGVAILALFTALGLALNSRGRGLAAMALIAFVLLDGVLAVDWLMSLDTGFHSSGFGLYVLALQVLTAFSVILLTTEPDPPAQDVRLLGALFLAVQLLWPYFAFMQYFIIWSNDLPKLAQWYLARGVEPWGLAARIFTGLHLAGLLALLFPPVRGNIGLLRLIAAASLVATGLEYLWLVLPTLPRGQGTALAAFALSLFGMAQARGGVR
ncbi:hypothetical protein [Shinella sp.]|uniref:hypothetical protein n=1 Tax=Shinella sp. TaxID=1870904 RepID=UPI00301D3252